MGRRGWTALLVAPVLLLPAGCASDFSAGLASIDACRVANTLATVSADDLEALAESLTAFSTVLPEELRPAALLLAQPADGSADSSARLAALAELQTWTMDTCGSYLTIGAEPDATRSAADARLADFETITGESDGAAYVSVLGVHDPEVALALCEQAFAEHAASSSQVHVQVLDPIGHALATSTDDGCALSP